MQTGLNRYIDVGLGLLTPDPASLNVIRHPPALETVLMREVSPGTSYNSLGIGSWPALALIKRKMLVPM